MRRARPPLTEPTPVACLFVTEVDVVASDGHVRLVGVVEVPALGSAQAERRIVGRWVLSFGTARELERVLHRLLANSVN